MIVIDSHLPKVLESIQMLKDKKEINQIKVNTTTTQEYETQL